MSSIKIRLETRAAFYINLAWAFESMKAQPLGKKKTPIKCAGFMFFEMLFTSLLT